ncbi:MAG: hypothetical protein EOO67_19155, partial [Microbacterium sp.]
MKRRTRVLLLALIAGLFALPAVPASAETTPSVTLTKDKAVYNAGQTVRMTSKITAMNLNWVVAVQFPGSSEWKPLCARYNVNDSVASCTLGVYYNAKVRAQLLDPADDSVKASSGVVDIPVRATVGTIPLGYYTRSGSYAAMSKYSAKFRSQSSPAFPGQRCLRHQVQRKYAAGWRLVKTSACIVEGKQGRVDWQWTGTH